MIAADRPFLALRRRAAAVSTIAACTAAAVALAGCGDDDATTATTAATTQSRTVDSSMIEGEIKEQLSTSGAKVSTVKCPSDVEASVGTTFTCSATWTNGATGKVEVTETSPSRYTYEPVPGSVKVPGATVDTSVEQALAEQGYPDATVGCPETVVVKVGSTVTCDVSGAGGQATGTVTFTFSNASGTVDPSSVETG